jgi:pyrroloquinoline quinone biosynthesis protein B
LRSQIETTAALHPHNGLRGSPISAVVLTGAEVDQIAGLLALRERSKFNLYATAETLAVIANNPIFGVLASDVVERHPVALSRRFELPGGLAAELFAVPGKVALYLENGEPEIAAQSGINVGVEISSDDKRLIYVPGAADLNKSLTERLERADVVLFDATLFDDDEMIRREAEGARSLMLGLEEDAQIVLRFDIGVSKAAAMDALIDGGLERNSQ